MMPEGPPSGSILAQELAPRRAKQRALWLDAAFGSENSVICHSANPSIFNYLSCLAGKNQAFPMKGYERIAEDKRLQRRTVQDALAVLRIEAGFTDADRAEFHMFGMRLASGAEVALIDLRYDNPSRENIAIVSLPTCSFFRAVRDGAAHRERLPIALLDGSIVDGGGKGCPERWYGLPRHRGGARLPTV